MLEHKVAKLEGALGMDGGDTVTIYCADGPLCLPRERFTPGSMGRPLRTWATRAQYVAIIERRAAKAGPRLGDAPDDEARVRELLSIAPESGILFRGERLVVIECGDESASERADHATSPPC